MEEDSLEKSMENIAQKIKTTDQRMDTLAEQVSNMGSDVYSEDGETIQVNNLLKSVNEVKENYQSLQKDLLEVQSLQKQLSSLLQTELRLVQSKFNTLKQKVASENIPRSRILSRSQSISSSHTRQEYIGFENE